MSGEGRCQRCGDAPAQVGSTTCSACADSRDRSGTSADLAAGDALAPGPDAELPAPGVDLGGLVVRRRLGEGGMGHVVLAHDPALDRPAAVKFLHRRLLADPGARRRFVREARALAEVVHPCVVRVYSVGEWNGWPYLAMEYVDGTTLARVVRAGRVPIGEALRIAEDLASALAAVHARRLTHRDVNPANVVLRHHDRRACLIDFGLARSLDRTTASSSGVAGTPLYMAPEQVAGRAQDVRVDVYAFGVTLFELLTGSPPHEPSEPGAFFHTVLHTDAPPLRDKLPDAPESLDALLARALARAPELRHPDGAAVLRDVQAVRRELAGAPDQGDAAGRVSDAVVALLPPSDPAEELPLLGRDEEYARAGAAVLALRRRRGGVLLIEGSPGSGKSRLLRDLARTARANGIAVLSATAEDTPAAAPYAALRSGLLAAAAPQGAESLLRSVAASSPERSALVPAIRWVLDGPAADGFAPGKPTVARAVLALVRAAVGERPALLVLDDLHYADEATLDVVVALAEEAPSLPLVVAASFRPAALLGASAPLPPRIARMRGVPGCTSVELGPLSEAAVAAIVARSMRVPEPEARRLAPLLHRRSAGNPLYVLESLRLLEQEGRLGRATDDRATDGRAAIRQRLSNLSIPPRLLELALRRVAGLPEEEREALAVVAIDPEGVTADLVARCRGIAKLAALRVLQQLVRARGLVKEEAGRYVVAHAETRDAIYGELIPELRAAYHDCAATHLIDLGVAATDPGRVGRHLRLAGRRTEAVEPLARAGQRLLLAHSAADALEVLDEALACAGPTGLPAEAAVARAAALERCGDLDAANAEIERLSALPGEVGVRATLLLARFEGNRGRDDVAQRVLDRLRDADMSVEFRAEMHVLEAQIASRTNRTKDALRALSAAETLALDVPRPLLLRLWATEGTVRYRADHYQDARVWWERALALAEELGAHEEAAVTLHNLGLTCQDLGLPDEAAAWALRAADRATAIGADRVVVFALLQLAALQVAALQSDAAEATLAKARPVLDRCHSDEAEYAFCARETEIALARHTFDRALARADRGVALSHLHPRNEASFGLLRALALLGLDRAEDALDVARATRAAFYRLGAEEEGEEALALTARALRTLGRSGREIAELRALTAATTFTGALERAMAETGEARERLRPDAERLARTARERAELRTLLG